ncbi:MAG TPA: carboxylating nicotinate-nucleotide diphosphorylase [Verrucomicrobiae bacterium]|nr:carboxylating nicotinate-nucleotide diphosphorylase [Verrucomicrobiae bacterium]
MNSLSPDLIRNLVRAALAEDIGAGDITTETAIPADQAAEAYIVAKERCVAAGLPLIEEVFAQIDRAVTVKLLVAEGDVVGKGTQVCVLNGSARAVLTGERTALNFLQRLSGIATLTRQFVDEIKGTKAKILDTRKTTPTLRLLEKYAVAVGGGTNHRMGLYDAVMIKDNHRAILARLGPKALGDAVGAARKDHPSVPIIIEADTLEQVEEALAAGADHILLDNMTPDELREAVALVAGRAKTEASGGVTLETVRAIAQTGVDYISAGALTHSARSVDFSLEVGE